MELHLEHLQWPAETNIETYFNNKHQSRFSDQLHLFVQLWWEIKVLESEPGFKNTSTDRCTWELHSTWSGGVCDAPLVAGDPSASNLQGL